MRIRKAATANAALFKSDISDNKAARSRFEAAEVGPSGKLYGTLTCQRCYKLALIVLEVGADGYRLNRVEGNCKHVPEQDIKNG
jgi:hypothetical protein